MAFWGVEVKPGKSFTLKATETKGMHRLHLSQATLGLGNATTTRCTLQCNVGTKSPVFLCALYPQKVDTCQLNIEFEEADDVIFSVLGPRSVHLTGYFPGRSNSLVPNDDESESYGEDIAGSDMDKASSDDYDYSDSFINDSDPCGHVSSTDDDQSKKNGKGRRLRKKFQVADSESDKTSAGLDDSSNGDSMKVLSSEATSSSCEIGEPNAKSDKTSEATTPPAKSEDKPLGDVKLSKKRQNKESVVIVDSDDDGEGKQSLENEKPAAHKETKSSSDVLPCENGDATPSKKKKKRKRDRREETRDVEKSLSKSPKRKKQAIDKKIKDGADTKKPLENEVVIIEEIEKGKLDGKVALKGKKVSIRYTAKLKDTGKLFASNLVEDAPLRFRLDGNKVIKGLSIGVEGMQVGGKRRLIIPPSLGYSEEGLKDVVPKNAWLVYEVEAVKI